MGYTEVHWNKRIASRSDLSSQVIHLTRSAEYEGNKIGPVDVMFKILKERKISGSTTESGFICGNVPATCFQDAPVYSVCQNINAEEEYRKAVIEAKVRYVGVGLMFPKPYVFAQGGRPVVYETFEKAKDILPEAEWWRIVRHDLTDLDNIVDWTHEREWRVPGGFDFELDEVTVVVPSKVGYQRFLKLCKAFEDDDILGEIKGIVNLGAVFY